MLHYSQLSQTTNMKSEKVRHRLNADGTIDSICLRCYLTAAKLRTKPIFRSLRRLTGVTTKSLSF
jgi:hypothetical protein